MEVEEWIDGINQPEWGRGEKQIFEPGGEPYTLEARYVFSLTGGNPAELTNAGGSGEESTSTSVPIVVQTNSQGKLDAVSANAAGKGIGVNLAAVVVLAAGVACLL